MAAHGAHDLPPPPGETPVGGTAPSPTPLSKERVASAFYNGFVEEAHVTMQPGECQPIHLSQAWQGKNFSNCLCNVNKTGCGVQCRGSAAHSLFVVFTLGLATCCYWP